MNPHLMPLREVERILVLDRHFGVFEDCGDCGARTVLGEMFYRDDKHICERCFRMREGKGRR